jgi:hypothetical protein
MHILLVVFCSLVTSVIWNLNQNANANDLDSVIQPASGAVETVEVSKITTIRNAGNFVVPAVVETTVQGGNSINASLRTFEQKPSVTAVEPPGNFVVPVVTTPKADTATPDNTQPGSMNSSDETESEDGLGEVEIIRRPIPRRQPDIQLQIRSTGFFNLDATGLSSSATLLATPKIGPETRLVAFAGGGILLFQQLATSDFSFLNAGVGVRHKLAEDTYGQVGFLHERLYRTTANAFVVDNSLRLGVDWERQLAPKLRLNTAYELRGSFTDQSTPFDRSRIANSLVVGLRYDITPQLESALGYQLVVNSFTGTNGFTGKPIGTKVEQQVGASMTYRFSSTTFVTGSVSYLFGRAFDPFFGPVELNNIVFCVGIGFNFF